MNDTEEDKQLFLTINKNLSQIFRNLSQVNQITIDNNESCTEEIKNCYNKLNNKITLLKQEVNKIFDNPKESFNSFNEFNVPQKISISSKASKILNENILNSMEELEESTKEQNKEIDRFNAEKDKLFNQRISNQPKKN